MNFRILKGGEFLDQLRASSFWRRALLHGLRELSSSLS